MSRNDKPDTLGQSLLGVPDMLSGILTSLDGEPAKRYFPNGINKIRIAVTVGAASVDLEIEGVATPSSDVVKIFSLVRPMFIYRSHAGHIGSLIVSAAAAGPVVGAKSYVLQPGVWEIYDYQDTPPVANTFPDAQPTNGPDSDQVWFWIGDGGGFTYTVTGVLAATNVRTSTTLSVTGNQWYLLDFGKKAQAIQHQKPWS